MEDNKKEDKRPLGFDYQNTIFYLRRPYSSAIETIHQPMSKSEHAALVKKAVDSQMYLWYSSKSRPSQLLIDFDSVPDLPYTALEQPAPKSSGFICPKCGKSMLSKSGYTLHLKQKHGYDS